jgi:hypothetical protein
MDAGTSHALSALTASKSAVFDSVTVVAGAICAGFIAQVLVATRVFTARQRGWKGTAYRACRASFWGLVFLLGFATHWGWEFLRGG